MVFICTSLCPLDVENLLWSFLTISHLYGRRKEQHRSTYSEPRPNAKKKKKKKIYSLITYRSDFRHLSTHSVILYSPRMSSYYERCT